MLLHHLPPVELWQREAMSRHLHAGDLGVHAERSVGCDVFAETSVKRRQYRHGLVMNDVAMGRSNRLPADWRIPGSSPSLARQVKRVECHGCL